MKLAIKKSKTVNEIKTEFNNCFEYLKIEFCAQPHKNKEGTSKKFIYTTDKKLSELSTKIIEQTIELEVTMTVGALESIFQNEIGLPIQVFRKSGPSWLETTSTDDWTLEKQNQFGKMLAVKVPKEKVNEFDNDAIK